MDLSIVVPVFNEAETLTTLVDQIQSVEAEHQHDIRVIFVDDGSTDESWKTIETLAAENPRISGIRFRRNFGKACALSAGIEAVETDIVFTMDADLQDDPAEIPKFLEMLEQGYDVVSGWKKVRHDGIGKTFPSKVFNGLVSRTTGVKLHDHNCGFKMYRRAVFDDINLYGELHRFVPVLASGKGWRVGEVVVNHRPRTYGKSKYGASRFVKGILDLLTVRFLTGYDARPQHLMGSTGLISISVGILGLIYLAGYWVVRQYYLGLDPAIEIGPPVSSRALLYYCLAAFLFGAQLLSLGLLAELVVAGRLRQEKIYSIRQRTHEDRSS